MKAQILCSMTLSRKSCNILEDENIIWRMPFASWITKASDTQSEYVTLLVFPWQQWLCESASMFMICTLPVLLRIKFGNIYNY